MAIFNAFTVDVEEHFQVSGFADYIPREHWDQHESRVVGNTERLLELLDSQNVQATFFIVGWLAERFPQLVRRIHEDGHEIGSHSYWHQLIYTQTPGEFREDLCRSRDVLQDITGQAVRMYRAPSFSVTRRSLWALEILVEEGFHIDSSIFPIKRDRYGIPHAPRGIYQIRTPSGNLWEFPPSVIRLGGRNFPLTGGGYFRLYPFAWTRHSLARLNKSGQPFMFYVHPWEIDHQQPRLAAGSILNRFRHYVNLARTESKLKELLSRFRFGTVTDVISDGLLSRADANDVCDSLEDLAHVRGIDSPVVSASHLSGESNGAVPGMRGAG